MSLLYLVLALVALQRLGELALAARNTRALRAAGAIELDASAYPLFVLLHGAWLASLALFVPASAPPHGRFSERSPPCNSAGFG